jgi:V-type H+-transporting ATPase 16kDa proteolipid subunit
LFQFLYLEIVKTKLFVVKVKEGYSFYSGFIHFSSGLSTGLACLSSGLAIGHVGAVGIRTLAKQPRYFTGFILILIFCEMIGLFGLIIGLMTNVSGNKK